MRFDFAGNIANLNFRKGVDDKFGIAETIFLVAVQHDVAAHRQNALNFEVEIVVRLLVDDDTLGADSNRDFLIRKIAAKFLGCF